MRNKQEYQFENSPFYLENIRVRASLKELETSDKKDVVLARKRFFKHDEYVKFIISNEFDIKSYYKLSNVSKTILQYILYHCLEYNNPVFKFKAKDFAIIIETDVGYIHKGINKLIDFNLIARTTTKELYWINHNIFYKGNFIVDKYLKTK